MKKTVDEKLDNVFDIVPTVVSENTTVVAKEETISTEQAEDGNIDADYEYARGNLKGLIESGKVAMENIIFLAKEGESPRAYEVVGQLIKTLAETNKDLLELGKKVKEARGKEKDSSPQHVTNALFVGSTAELQKMLKGK